MNFPRLLSVSSSKNYGQVFKKMHKRSQTKTSMSHQENNNTKWKQMQYPSRIKIEAEKY
jgi:hypothetical protein